VPLSGAIWGPRARQCIDDIDDVDQHRPNSVDRFTHVRSGPIILPASTSCLLALHRSVIVTDLSIKPNIIYIFHMNRFYVKTFVVYGLGTLSFFTIKHKFNDVH
jgi:hypothetical protein